MKINIAIHARPVICQLILTLLFSTNSFSQQNRKQTAALSNPTTSKIIPANPAMRKKTEINKQSTNPDKLTKPVIPGWVPRNKDGTPDKRLKQHYPVQHNGTQN